MPRSARACAPAATLSAALADADPQVRKAALERLAAQKDKLEPAVLDRTLALAVRDPNPELSQLALTTIARVAPKERSPRGSRARSVRAPSASARRPPRPRSGSSIAMPR